MAGNITLLFYDLETSGFSPKDARIMQFAGQRTDLGLNPIGEPYNFLIRMTDDTLPEPDAVLITGITPQKTIADGISEAEFLKIFHDEIALAGTIFVGFNTVRFDDEFMRYLHYRNFYDPYEWQWQDKRSKWDLLDVVRMTRALRPEGIKWPFDAKGNPANRLEYLTQVNELTHDNAHDALGDVRATIELARLIYKNQPDLFKFLLKMRKKDNIARLVASGEAFVYTSGKYASEFEKTTVAAMVCEHPKQSGGALVFDLRYDPTPFLKLEPGPLAEAWRKRKDDPGPRLPVKTLKYNRCPAVAPLNVLDEASQQRLKLNPKTYMANLKKLNKIKQELCHNLNLALEIMDKKQQAKLLEDETEVDAQLYDGFFDKEDQQSMRAVRTASVDELAAIKPLFYDSRLGALLPLYKARNYPKAMNDDERQMWERFKERKLLSGGTESRMARYFARIGELRSRSDLNDEQQYLLEELQLYAQSIMPDEAG
jgi:exodeoxyribonuclease I